MSPPHPLQAALIGQGYFGPVVDLDEASPSQEQVSKDMATSTAATTAIAPILYPLKVPVLMYVSPYGWHLADRRRAEAVSSVAGGSESELSVFSCEFDQSRKPRA